MHLDSLSRKEKTLLIALTPKVGIKTYLDLVEKYRDEDVILNEIESIGYKLDIERFLNVSAILDKKNIQYKCLWEDDYPELLKNISDPPIVLFHLGNYNKNKIDNSFSIVGTRMPSSYGIKYAKIFTRDVILCGYSTVSGLALGVDSLVHKESINFKGYTIAVLATSPNTPSPYSNEKLYKSIIESGGVILSETFPDESINKGAFLVRNRIIAGLSLGTIVIEAGDRSGTLTTADLALNYNKNVFALPGNVDNFTSIGCNNLIKQSKAKLVESIDDILIEYGYITSNKHNTEIRDLSDLDFFEQEVYNSLLSGPKFVEEISILIKIELIELLGKLSMLELKGIVFKNKEGKFSLL